jgi:hypothetical protein
VDLELPVIDFDTTQPAATPVADGDDHLVSGVDDHLDDSLKLVPLTVPAIAAHRPLVTGHRQAVNRTAVQRPAPWRERQQRAPITP